MYNEKQFITLTDLLARIKPKVHARSKTCGMYRAYRKWKKGRYHEKGLTEVM